MAGGPTFDSYELDEDDTRELAAGRVPTWIVDGCRSSLERAATYVCPDRSPECLGAEHESCARPGCFCVCHPKPTPPPAKARAQHALQPQASPLGLLVYKDPQCRNRHLVVESTWDLNELAAEVARPGGMRVGPLFIGTSVAVQGFLMGVEHARSRR